MNFCVRRGVVDCYTLVAWNFVLTSASLEQDTLLLHIVYGLRFPGTPVFADNMAKLLCMNRNFASVHQIFIQPIVFRDSILPRVAAEIFWEVHIILVENYKRNWWQNGYMCIQICRLVRIEFMARQHEIYLPALRACSWNLLAPSESSQSPLFVHCIYCHSYKPIGHVNLKCACPPKKSMCLRRLGSHLIAPWSWVTVLGIQVVWRQSSHQSCNELSLDSG